MKNQKFSHKTPHLKGKQHQLDPNLDLKQLVHHSTVQYVDRDADGDVDIYDNPKKKTPDENPTGVDVGALSKKLIAKQKGELKHTKRGLAYEETKSGDSSLRDWFTKSRSSDGTPGWVQLGGKYAGKPCAKQPGQTTKPKCGSSKMKRNLDDEEEQRAFERKNRQDPNPDRKGRAKNVATEAVDATKYGGPDKLLQRLVPKGEKVIPSTPKKSANVKESYLRIQERGKTYSIILNWRGKSITTQMFFPKFGRPSKSEVLGEIVKVYPGAKVLYYNPVMRDPTQPLLFAGTQNEPR